MRRRRGYTRTVQSHFTLLILSRVAFLLSPLSPRRLHLCVPPSEPSTIQSSTFTFSTPPPQRARAHYAADTLLRPIEIFIPARLPSQFMPRTSEMYCYHVVLPCYSPPSVAIAAPREWQGGLDVRFSSFIPWNTLVFLNVSTEGSCEVRSFTSKITDKMERTSISMKTLSAFLSELRGISQTCRVRCVSDTARSHDYFASVRLSISRLVFFPRYWEERPLYVCLTRTRVNNRIVKYFSVTPHDSRREPSLRITKVD